MINMKFASKLKGNRGYLKSKKIHYLLTALGMAVLILCMVITGFVITGDTKNLFTIVGVLLALPFANIVTLYVATFPYSAPPQDEYNQVESAVKSGVFLTELAVTSPALKTIYFPYAVVTEKAVAACTMQKSVNCKDYEKYISNMLALNNLSIPVKVFNDFSSFTRYLKSMPGSSDNSSDEALEAVGCILRLSL